MTNKKENTGQLIEIPSNHDLLWYHAKNTERISIFNPSVDIDTWERTSLGDARKWLENNISKKVYFKFVEETRTINDIVQPGISIVLLFDSNDDYLAFKIVFPELCRQDI